MYEYTYQLKRAWNSIKGRKGLSLSVISTMGLTFGTFFCAASLFYTLIVKPLPYPDQERLYSIEQVQIDNSGQKNVRALTYANLIYFYKNQQLFSEVGLAHYADEVLSSQPNQPRLYTAYITPDFMSTIGATVYLGRLFDSTEGLDKNSPSALLSFDSWKNNFSSDQGIIGQGVQFRGRSFTIVGVLSPNFIEPEIERIGRKTSVWLPWDFNPTSERGRQSWGGRASPRVLIGKLKEHISSQLAATESTTIANNAWTKNVENIPFYKGWRIEMELVSFQHAILGGSKLFAYLLLACAISLLLIAVANISNLFLARAFERKNEFAICAAVGATAKDLIRMVFIESSLLMLIALFVGLFLAQFGIVFIKQFMSDALPLNADYSTSAIILFIGVFISFLLAFIFAVISAKVIDYKQLQRPLSGSGKGVGAQISNRVRNGFVLSQVFIASVLIFINLTFFISAVSAIRAQDIIKTDNLVSVRIALNTTETISRQQRQTMIGEVRDSLLLLPEVEAIALTRSPLDSDFNTWSLTEVSSLKHVLPQAINIDEQYFELTETMLIEGHGFSKAQVKDGERILIINDVLAKRLAPNGSALGMHLSFDVSQGDEMSFRIVGVVRGMRLPGGANIPPRVYRPRSSTDSIIIKLVPNHTLPSQLLRKLVGNVSNLMVVYDQNDLSQQKDHKLLNQYITAGASMALTIVSGLLTAIGLFGIISYNIHLRRLEIGIRISVGAKRKDIIALFIRDISRPFIIGLVLSTVFSIILINQLDGHFISIVKTHGLMMVTVTLGFMLLITLFSTLLPLSRRFKDSTVNLLRENTN